MRSSRCLPKSTKGMLEMQRLAPEMRRLQQQYKTDRQKLNEEMMKLYQNKTQWPRLPLLHKPVFIVMFRIFMTQRIPAVAMELFMGAMLTSVVGVKVIGSSSVSLDSRDVARRSRAKLRCRHGGLTSQNHRRACWVATLAKASFMPACGGSGRVAHQQRMVAARASISPTMSESQQKLMQYLPVVFAARSSFLRW